jgi:ammonium transporter, Amt family
MACIVTNLAASCGGLTWLFIDKIHLEEKKWGAIGWCSGAVAGLVAITPAAGFVPPWSAVIIGSLGSAACNYATRFKYLIGIDEHLDIFAIHAIGGIVGNLLTYHLLPSPVDLSFQVSDDNISGLFAADYIAALDGITKIDGGWVNHHYIQLAYQLCNCVTGFAYAFLVTLLILLVMNYTPGLSLRVSEEEEMDGIDEVEIGHPAYNFEQEVHVVQPQIPMIPIVPRQRPMEQTKEKV